MARRFTPRPCDACTTPFTPAGPSGLYCPACADIRKQAAKLARRKEKRNEKIDEALQLFDEVQGRIGRARATLEIPPPVPLPGSTLYELVRERHWLLIRLKKYDLEPDCDDDLDRTVIIDGG